MSFAIPLFAMLPPTPLHIDVKMHYLNYVLIVRSEKGKSTTQILFYLRKSEVIATYIEERYFVNLNAFVINGGYKSVFWLMPFGFN